MKTISSFEDAINILKELKLCEQDINGINFNITGCSEQDAKLVDINMRKMHEILSELEVEDLEVICNPKVINIKKLKEAVEQEQEDAVRRDIVLGVDYINWFIEFIKEEKSFNTEPNNVGYNKIWSEAEKEKVLLIDTLFALISEYYSYHGIVIKQKNADFLNQVVSVNLTYNVSVEMVLWQGQGSLVEVNLIIPDTGDVRIEDLMYHFRYE